MKLSESCDAAADLISNPKRWIRGRTFDYFTGRMCAVGALETTTPDFYALQELKRLAGLVGRRRYPQNTLAGVNDNFGRLAAVKVLRETAEMLRRWKF